MIKKKILFVLMMVLMAVMFFALPAWAEDPAEYQGFLFDEATGTITGYEGEGGDVVIPREIEGVPVTAVGAYAFKGHFGLTSVRFTTGVATIGQGAFLECIHLRSAFFPDTITSVGTKAFSKCTALTDVSFADMNADVASDAFLRVGSAAACDLTFRNDGWTDPKTYDVDWKGGVFNVRQQQDGDTPVNNDFTYEKVDDGTGKTVIRITGYQGNSKDIVIPAQIEEKDVTIIGTKAFDNKRFINSIKLPETITTIEENAFSYCVRMNSINFPAGLKSLAEAALYGCGKLREIDLSKCREIKKIKDYTFFSCSSLTDIKFPPELESIGKHAFHWCQQLPKVDLPNTLQKIGSEAFSITMLQTLTIPKSVTTIDTKAFANNDNLTLVTFLAESPTTITFGDDVFKCSGKVSVCQLRFPDNDSWNRYADKNVLIEQDEPITWLGANYFQVRKVHSIKVTNAGHGKASADMKQGILGDQVTLTNTPDDGYQFDRWEVIAGGVEIADDQFTIGTQNIEIKAYFKPVQLTKISVTSSPSKTEYLDDDPFETAGMVITATYTNGTSREVTGWTVSPKTLTMDVTDVTVSYSEKDIENHDIEKTTVQPVVVYRRLTDIEVTTLPSKIIYIKGESFDKTGMVVTAAYSDGTSGEITDYTFSPAGALKATDMTISVTYIERGVSKSDQIAVEITATIAETKEDALKTMEELMGAHPSDAMMVIYLSYALRIQKAETKAEIATILTEGINAINAQKQKEIQVTLNKTSAKLYAREDKNNGDTIQLTATVTMPGTVVENPSVTWTSSNKKIAKVDGNGLVRTFAKTGKVTITASYGDKSASCVIQVKKETKDVQKLIIKKKKLTMKKGETLALRIKFKPANTYWTKLKWNTSNKKVVKVNAAKRTLKAVGKGSCTVTIQSVHDPNVKLKIKIKVK